jgi:Transposase DDE domain group 1
LFSDLQKKPLVLSFDQREGSSDGGTVLLEAANRRYGLIESMAGCLRDRRQASKVEHSLAELLGQRIHGLACGYPDANDTARLESDPVHKLLLGRDPLAGRDLASQPTLSRFENAAGPRELYRMSEQLARRVIEQHGKRLGGHARRVTVDLDPTDDATHGAQQLSFFNAHYDSWCYLPVSHAQESLSATNPSARRPRKSLPGGSSTPSPTSAERDHPSAGQSLHVHE